MELFDSLYSEKNFSEIFLNVWIFEIILAQLDHVT